MENEGQDMKHTCPDGCACRCHNGGHRHGKFRGKHGWHKSCGGGFWFAGWLFTLGFLKLAFWKGVFAIIVWPYFIGSWVNGLVQ